MKQLLVIIASLFIFACGTETTKQSAEKPTATSQPATSQPSGQLKYNKEKNFKKLTQLTYGGDNAEAYFSFDNSKLVFQASNEKWDAPCDQIFMMPLTGTDKGAKPPLLSTGKGRTTCSYFMPGDSTVLYASTHLADAECPDSPRTVDGKYVWPIYESFDIFVSDMNGNIVKQLTKDPGYDAEATLSPDGKMIVFTSMRSGDLELYTMDINGNNVKQITSGLGYDGGAFFSPDGKKLVFRSSRPKTDEEVKNYKSFLDRGLVQPTNMEIYTCNIDGSNLKQITSLGKANWAPYYHPNGKTILFSTNHHQPSGRVFNIFSINEDGSDLKQITFDNTFDAFPMFSYDGKYLAFSSNRNNGGTRDTNVFLAEWQD